MPKLYVDAPDLLRSVSFYKNIVIKYQEMQTKCDSFFLYYFSTHINIFSFKVYTT